MKLKWIVMLPAVLCWLASCQKAGPGRPDGEEDIQRPGAGQEQEEVVYVTGVGIPLSFDWRKSGRDSSDVQLLVFRNGLKYLSLPVGPEYRTSPHADMHRLIRGKLYTDYSTGASTVIAENGHQLFEYPGREMMCGFQVRGQEVRTLGADRDGTGFSYRKNGELIFSDADAVPVGEMGSCLYEDAGDFCFVYRKKYGNLSSDLGPWYEYSRGEARQVPLREDFSSILAARHLKGELAVLAAVKGSHEWVVVWGENTFPMGDLTAGQTLRHCRLLSDGRELYVQVKTGIGLNQQNRIIRCRDRQVLSESLHTPFFVADGQDCAAVSFKRDEIRIWHSSAGERLVDGPLWIRSASSIALSRGKTWLLLSPYNLADPPVLWVDGRMEKIPFKGRPTSVVVETGAR